MALLGCLHRIRIGIFYRTRMRQVLNQKQPATHSPAPLLALLETHRQLYHSAFALVLEQWSSELLAEMASIELLPSEESQAATQQLIGRVNQRQPGALLAIEGIGRHLRLMDADEQWGNSKRRDGSGDNWLRGQENMGKTRSTSLLKGRSLSGSRQKRTASKVSCFAEAKVKAAPSNTAAQFFKGSSQQIKKGKRKGANLFGGAGMNHTSPSVFMLEYAEQAKATPKAAAEREERDRVEAGKLLTRARHEEEREKQRQMVVSLEGRVQEQLKALADQCEVIKTQQKTLEQQQAQQAKEVKQARQVSQANQGQFDRAQSRSNSRAEVKENPVEQSGKESQGVAEATRQQQLRHLNTISQNISRIDEAVKHHPHPEPPQSRSRQSSQLMGVSGVKQVSEAVRSVVKEDKVVRKRGVATDVDQSQVECIDLQPRRPHKRTVTEESEQSRASKQSSNKRGSKEVKALSQQAESIKQALLSFHRTTLKVKLPVSKKLIGLLKLKYSRYTKGIGLKVCGEVAELDEEAVGGHEVRELLGKMEKLTVLKCDPEKKEKLLEYVGGFLHCFLSMGGDAAARQVEKTTAPFVLREQLAQALKISEI